MKREGVPVNGVAMVIPFCTETERGWNNILRCSVARLISQANKSLAALAVLKYMFKQDSRSALRNKRAKEKNAVLPRLNALYLLALIGLLINPFLSGL